MQRAGETGIITSVLETYSLTMFFMSSLWMTQSLDVRNIHPCMYKNVVRGTKRSRSPIVVIWSENEMRSKSADTPRARVIC